MLTPRLHASWAANSLEHWMLLGCNLTPVSLSVSVIDVLWPRPCTGTLHA